MEYQVALSSRAGRDLAEIWHHFHDADSAVATQHCIDLVRHAYSLKTFPERNVEFGSGRKVRKMSFGNYLIFYRVHRDQHRVKILRFWHGARDRERLRLKENGAAYSASAQEFQTAAAAK